jgi:hypothetical protein
VVEIPHVWKMKHDPYWDEISGHLFTLSKGQKKALSTIRTKLESYIHENFGRYSGAVTLLDKLVIEESEE